VIQPFLTVERTVEREPGCWPCQALAAEGGGRQARLYNGQASPAMIATGDRWAAVQRPCARAKPLAARYATHSKFNRATIEVHATFKDENGFFGLTSYLDYAERELKQSHACAQLAQKQHGVGFEFPWEHIDQRPIETIGFLKDQFEFKIDTFKILELLTGHTLYNDSGVVLRELVQNSIDAVRLQFSSPGRKRSREEGRVAIHWDSQARVLTVTDNGTGMSQEIIKNHLLEVGSSRYQDPKFQEEHPDFSSISRFGIGVLSTFMVADEVEYLTYFPGEEQARRLLLRSVHGKYLVRLLDKGDDRVRHLVPHGTEICLKLRHTAEMDDPVELAKKWIVVPDCSVTVQRDREPVQAIGFPTPKEALESVLTKTGYDLSLDSRTPIKVEQVERNGVTLACALYWSDYFREWTFLSAPRYERETDAELSAERLLGTCVEGIRVDTDTPGFGERNIYAIANATGRLAPKTNVARSGLETSSEVSALFRSLYSVYLGYIESEVRALWSERGFSPTWAAGEPRFMLDSLLRSRKEASSQSQVEIKDTRAFGEAIEEAKLVLVEDENHRKITSSRALLAGDHFWTIDCALFGSMERLLREVPESASVRSLSKTLSQSIDLPTGVLLPHWDLHDFLSNLIFAKREVGEIRIDERQRRTDLKWIAQTDNPRWIRPLSDWPRASDNAVRLLRRGTYLYSSDPLSALENLRILRPQAEVTLNGIKDEMTVSAFRLDFLLSSPLQVFFTKEISPLSVEANDLRLALLSIVAGSIRSTRSAAQADKAFEERNRDGFWNTMVDYCGQTARAEITACWAAAGESSWKRFSADLWIRGRQ
jgi:molecular chaperone HtpG